MDRVLKIRPLQYTMHINSVRNRKTSSALHIYGLSPIVGREIWETIHEKFYH